MRLWEEDEDASALELREAGVRACRRWTGEERLESEAADDADGNCREASMSRCLRPDRVACLWTDCEEDGSCDNVGKYCTLVKVTRRQTRVGRECVCASQ